MTEQVLLTADDMRRAIVRVAHEILEANRGSKGLVMIGMRTRGVPLARRMAGAIAAIEGETVPVGALDIGLYRDDLTTRGASIQLAPSEMPQDVSGKRAVLVDDVLFTGRSVRAALDALIDLGRPQRIELAVLVDRGHRELPIRADYVGKNLPTARNDVVKVRLVEVDGLDEVVVLPGEGEA